jgi:hypothetical protein
MKNQTLYFKLGEANKDWQKRAKNKSSRRPFWQTFLHKKNYLQFQQEKLPTYTQTIEYFDKGKNQFAVKKIPHFA